jgi:hypothetical protein
VGGRKRFTTTLEAGRAEDSLRFELPFDPDEVWGKKARHHLGGTLDGKHVRIVVAGGTRVATLGAMWARDCGVTAGAGKKVRVVLEPEGPQRDDLAPDVAAALAADPQAGAFWDGLAQFYRKAYLRWIDATKRSPSLRAERIAEVVALCADGVKERPRG